METGKKNYFEVKSTGFNEVSQREEIQINWGKNGVLYFFKTDEGFIVDVYNQSYNVNTLAVFETDLELDEELSLEDKVYRECESVYDNDGYSAVFAYADSQKKANNPDYKDVIEDHCSQCEDETPFLNGICLVCGTIKR